jgi:carbon-monoxide dehydrogenase medium subunit
MKRDFEYFAPNTIEEALALLSRYGDECKLIAGGQSLLILMRHELVSPKYLVDIKRIASLDYIKLDKNKGLSIGALTTHRTIETSPNIGNGFGVLAEMERTLASIQTRSWGTIGGNLCHADPAGDPAPVLIALDGKLRLVSLSNERIVAVEDFFKYYLEPALEPGELLSEIQVPNLSPNTGTAFKKISKVTGDYAIASVAVSITIGPKKGSCANVRIGLGGVSSIPLRAKRAEKALIGKKITEDVMREAANIAAEDTQPVTDINASEEYRREMTKLLVKEVVAEALEKASNP